MVSKLGRFFTVLLLLLKIFSEYTESMTIHGFQTAISHLSKLSKFRMVSQNDFVLTRNGAAENYAGLWQSKGDYYISYANLDLLQKQLTQFSTNRSKSDKRRLLHELTLVVLQYK